MSAKFGVWWCGRVAAAIFVLCILLGGMSPSAQEGQFFRIGAAATSGTFFEIGAVIASAISKPAALLLASTAAIAAFPGWWQ